MIDGVDDGPVTTAYIAGTANATGDMTVTAETDLAPVNFHADLCGVNIDLELTSTAIAGGRRPGRPVLPQRLQSISFDLTTTAYIADGVQINKDGAANGSVSVSATNTTSITSVTGSIGIGP